MKNMISIRDDKQPEFFLKEKKNQKKGYLKPPRSLLSWKLWFWVGKVYFLKDSGYISGWWN